MDRRNTIRIIESRIVSVSGEGFGRTVHTTKLCLIREPIKTDKKSVVN